MKEFLKSILMKIGLYHPMHRTYKQLQEFYLKRKLRKEYTRFSGSGFECNFCGAKYSQFVPEYPGKKDGHAIGKYEIVAGYGKNVYCPNCLSKNRERLIKAVLDTNFNINGKSILHLSPEKNLNWYLNTKAVVVSADLSPGFYKAIDKNVVKADLAKLPFADNNFDFVIANHILEHVPNDRLAMQEMRRVLKPGGIGILQIPYSEKLEITLEEPGIRDPERQSALFGQRDHVRVYALNDYVKRLESSGFDVKIKSASELTAFEHYATQAGEVVVVCVKSQVELHTIHFADS